MYLGGFFYLNFNKISHELDWIQKPDQNSIDKFVKTLCIIVKSPTYIFTESFASYSLILHITEKL